MTIKPLVNQKSGEKKESHGHQETQNQNLVVSNVRSTHRNVVINNKQNVESQAQQRHGDVYEDMARNRRSPHKSSRSKRDHHHKREQREREKVCSSPQYHQVLSGCSSPHNASTTVIKSPKHVSVSSSSSTSQATNNVLTVMEETFSGYNSGDEHVVPKETLLEPDEWKSRDEQFGKAMSERGFVVHEIVEDGACLFRAISLQVYGDQEMHEVVRQQTMDYIYANREYFTHFVTEDIDSYVTRKRKKDSHGNHIEIQAMSELYNRTVELYYYQTQPINIFNSEQMNNGYEPLRLSYHRGSHYNAIIDPYNASVGVGLGLAGYKPESQTHEAIRLSEELQIEKTMLEDKIKTTDWEATNEAIEEQIARESYLQWCRENMQKAQKSSANSTSSTVTSAEVTSSNQSNYNITTNSMCDTSSYSESNSKESHQFHNNVSVSNKTLCNNLPEQMHDQAKLLSASNVNNADTETERRASCENNDTNMSSTSSVEQYHDKLERMKISPIINTKRHKRRRGEEDKKCDSSVVTSDEIVTKRIKHFKKRVQAIAENGREILESTAPDVHLPGTSKQVNNEDIKPVSKFYQSLLESSYTDDGIGQLSENEMVLKAIQLSRMDFLQEQNRKFGENLYHEHRVDAADEDSDTPST